MEPEIMQKLIEQEAKIDAMYTSIEKMRKYFAWTFWITVLVVVIPAIALVFVIPSFMNSYVGGINSLL